MASKQTRRSISVRGTTYSLLRDFCTEHDRSMSDVVEELLGRILESSNDKPTKTVAPLIARAPSKPVSLKPEPDRAAVRVVPLPKPEPAPVRAALPPKPTLHVPERPTPVAHAGRPAPTPVKTVKETEGKGDYRAIRF